MADARPSDFRIEHHVLDGATMLVISGELDIASASQLADAAAKAAADGNGPVVLDLCDTAFIDSSGLRALLRAHDDLAGHGRRLAIACSSEPVLRVLEIAGLRDKLTIQRTQREALTSARGSPG